MIYEVEGDIRYSKAQAIAHGLAANDPMDEGLARQLHEYSPALHRDFHHWCHQKHPKPGEAFLWEGPDGIRIINLLTQEGGYGHGARPGKASTKNVNHALRALKKIIQKENLSSVALPALATGVGGLMWDDVQPLISNQLGDLEADIYIYSTYLPGKRAEEPNL